MDVHRPSSPKYFAPPGIGGALRLGGTADVFNCSFGSNSATNRGPAIAVGTTPVISNSSFDGNELFCEAGSYLDVEKVKHRGRWTHTHPIAEYPGTWLPAFRLVL